MCVISAYISFGTNKNCPKNLPYYFVYVSNVAKEALDDVNVNNDVSQKTNF